MGFWKFSLSTYKFRWVFKSSTWSDWLEVSTNPRCHFYVLYLVVFFNIAVVILTLVAMAFDRYCTVVPNIMTKTVNKHRNKRWFIFSVSSYKTHFPKIARFLRLLIFFHHNVAKMNFSDDWPDLDFGNNISVSCIYQGWKWQYHQQYVPS